MLHPTHLITDRLNFCHYISTILPFLSQADPLIKTARDAQQTPRGAAGVAPTSIRGLDNESSLNRMRAYPLPTKHMSGQMSSTGRRSMQVWADC